MKYIFKNATFSALVALLFAASALCMEKEEKAPKAIIFAEKSAQVLHFLLTERLDLFNHPMVHQLGRVSKSFDEVCWAAAPKIKQFVWQQVEPHSASTKISIWSRYGSACGWIDSCGKDSYLRYISSCMRLRFDKKIWLKQETYPLNGVPLNSFKPLKSFNSLRFDEMGDFYSYYINLPKNEIVELEFSLFENCDCFHRLCALRYVCNERVHNHSLCSFENLPNLMNSFVNSTFSMNIINERICKLFHLADAIIPENYEESTCPSDWCGAFERLPEDLKAAIIARYTEQHKKPREIADLLPVSLQNFVHNQDQQSGQETTHEQQQEIRKITDVLPAVLQDFVVAHHQESHHKQHKSAHELPEHAKEEKKHSLWHGHKK